MLYKSSSVSMDTHFLQKLTIFCQLRSPKKKVRSARVLGWRSNPLGASA